MAGGQSRTYNRTLAEIVKLKPVITHAVAVAHKRYFPRFSFLLNVVENQINRKTLF